MRLSKGVRQVVKHTAQRMGRLLPISLYLDRPLRRWPHVLGLLHGIAVPRGVKFNRTPEPRSGPANVNILLALMDRTENIPGDIAECGVFQGATLLAMALHARQRGTGKRLVGFDSFAGFDDSINIDINLGGADTDEFRKVGGFSDTSLELVSEKARRLHLSNVELAPGFFSQTLPAYDRREFSFVHLDCDMYRSYKDCLEFFYPRVAPGGIILFDEYNDPPWPGCNKAVNEFLLDKSEKLVRVVADNYEKYYITKLPKKQN
ncbi:MAG TPA: TylF/MycF/NovP-related O-methyltransferase [Candidatus Limnocylindrales bacterium]|nr:TylF/MycF/NovP-related O-methyltransferase [Candidatus Limnocylindrales bacterium]